MNFADINQMFLNMTQQAGGAKQNVVLQSDTGKHPDFSRYLQKAKSAQNGPDYLKEMPSVSPDPERLAADFSDHLPGESGQAFIQKLHQLLMKLSGNDLKNISTGSEGLDILAKLLEKAGFKKQDIDGLMDKMRQTAESETISMDTVMKHLFGLSEDALEDSDEEILLAASAQSFVVSLLQAFAIPENTIDAALSEANRHGGSISLDVIIEQLAALEKKSIYSHTPFEAENSDDTIGSLLDSLGMKLRKSKSSGVFLKDLIAAFQEYKSRQMDGKNSLVSDQNKSPAGALNIFQKDDDNFQELLSGWFKKLDIQVQKSTSPVAGIPQAEMAHDFLKNHFTGETGTHQKQAGFSTSFPEAASFDPDMKSEQTLKEIQALLSGKSSDGPDNRALFQKENTRLEKSFSSLANDQNQLSGADVKTRESLGDLAFLKTKNNFKNLPTYVTHQVGKSLVRAINHGENSLKLQLKPPELGRLVIHIDNTGNTMKVSIMTENHVAREMLTANVNELRTVLSSAGISLESFDVDMNSNFRQSMADARNQSNSSGDKKQSKDNLVHAPVSDSELEGLDHDSALSMQNGSLHYVA